MTDDFAFSITTTRFDENYAPSESSRITTNFANLARGEHRQENLRNTLTMIDRRFNDLMRADNPDGDRYTVELEIVSVALQFAESAPDERFPLIEVLDVQILDRHTGGRSHGIVGNNFSSYVRDYDFSVLLPAAAARAKERGEEPSLPDAFGELHGKLFQSFLSSETYRDRFSQPPVVCISVSTSKTYRSNGEHHPILGVEYVQEEQSLTDLYFGRMGLRAKYFMPRGSVAPLAFYFGGELPGAYSDLQLAGTISTMETFQKIYRPEIYNANSAAPAVYRPSLEAGDFSRTRIDYDRDERSRLALTQGKYTEEHFIEPHREALERWSAASETAIA